MKMEFRRKAIDKIYKRRDKIDMPDFQREEVWTSAKKRLLIDTILRGWHLPKFYFRKLEDGSFECVDGQQRLTAIFEFFDDNLVLASDTASMVGAKKYNDLPEEIMDNFDDYEIEIEEIEDADELELEDLFQRLQLGEPLNTAERLNAIGGQLRDFCHKLADQPFYSHKIVLRDTRYAHFENVVRWVFIESRGIQPQMRFPQFESLLKDNRSFSQNSETAKNIQKALKYLDKAFPEKCPYLRTRANVLSVCMLASRVVSSGIDRADPKIFGGFVEDFFKKLAIEVEKGNKSKDKELLRYQQAITSESMGGNSIRTRINILTKRVTTFSPQFVPLLGSFQDTADDATRDISEWASRIRSSIYDINEQYSSAHGEDLFKLTNKTTNSLNKLEIPIKDIKGYGDFIDNLYFLIYEGSGDCSRLPQPPDQIVMNIKFLRTSIRHDIDHGKAKEIARKKVRDANIFEKYSGKKTPFECSPEDFITIQTRILQDVTTFLESLI